MLPSIALTLALNASALLSPISSALSSCLLRFREPLLGDLEALCSRLDDFDRRRLCLELCFLRDVGLLRRLCLLCFLLICDSLSASLLLLLLRLCDRLCLCLPLLDDSSPECSLSLLLDAVPVLGLEPTTLDQQVSMFSSQQRWTRPLCSAS